MAYTRTWSDVTPADSDQASTLGLAIRNLRTDIEERMNTLTNNTWDADPVAKDIVMKINLPASLHARNNDPSTTDPFGHSTEAGWFCDWNDPGTPRQGMQLLAGTSYLYIPVVIPQLCTLTGIRMAGRVSASGGSIIVQAIDIGNQVGTMDSVTSAGSSASPTANGTWQMMSCGTLSHLMASGDVITVVIRGILGGRIVHYGGLEVTYTRPALWNTY